MVESKKRRIGVVADFGQVIVSLPEFRDTLYLLAADARALAKEILAAAEHVERQFIECGICQGHGLVEGPANNEGGYIVPSLNECPECHGTGGFKR